MSMSRQLIIVTAMLTAAFITGCADNNPADPDSSTRLDENYDLIVQDLGVLLADPDDGLTQDWIPRPINDTDLNLFELSNHWDRFTMLHDTTITFPGMTTVVDVTFFDSNGNEYELYDPETSVAMICEVGRRGHREGPGRSMTLQHHSSLRMRHIAPVDSIRLLNEAGHRMHEGHMRGRWNGAFRQIRTQSDWHAVDILMAADRDLHPYPLDGEVRCHTLLVRQAGDNGLRRRVEIEASTRTVLDGTRYARVIVNRNHVYWIDLETGIPYRERPGDGEG